MMNTGKKTSPVMKGSRLDETLKKLREYLDNPPVYEEAPESFSEFWAARIRQGCEKSYLYEDRVVENITKLSPWFARVIVFGTASLVVTGTTGNPALGLSPLGIILSSSLPQLPLPSIALLEALHMEGTARKVIEEFITLVNQITDKVPLISRGKASEPINQIRKHINKFRNSANENMEKLPAPIRKAIDMIIRKIWNVVSGKFIDRPVELLVRKPVCQKGIRKFFRMFVRATVATMTFPVALFDYMKSRKRKERQPEYVLATSATLAYGAT